VILDAAGWCLVLAGVALTILGGIGLVRFPDVFSRMHAATKPSCLGVLLVCGGVALVLDDGGDRAMLLLVAALQLVTAPVAAHMVGRAAYRDRAPVLSTFVVDDLRDAPDPDED